MCPYFLPKYSPQGYQCWQYKLKIKQCKGNEMFCCIKKSLQICVNSHDCYEQAQYGLCYLVNGKRGTQFSGTSLTWILLFSVSDMNFYNRARWGKCVDWDDSIYNEFLYNKTRSSLISNCIVENMNSAFGENLYHYNAKKIWTLKMPWLACIGQNGTLQTLGEALCQGDQGGFNRYGRRRTLDFIHCVLLALQ